MSLLTTWLASPAPDAAVEIAPSRISAATRSRGSGASSPFTTARAFRTRSTCGCRSGSALSQALSIASLINGPILGVFLVGTLMRRVSQPPALIGMLVSMGSMLYIFLATNIAWTWYVFIGSLITIVVAWLASFVLQAELPRLTQIEEE